MKNEDNAHENQGVGGGPGLPDPPEVTDIVVVGQPPSMDEDERPGNAPPSPPGLEVNSMNTKISFQITPKPSPASGYSYRVTKLTYAGQTTPLTIPSNYTCQWDGNSQKYIGPNFVRTFPIGSGTTFDCTYQIYQGSSPHGSPHTDPGTPS